ncbi:MAG: hypothetical protein M0Z68_06835 [Gammaproteobacteria bacterium]|nr:hypothetical protein [Gammaproteobacteria bacterium]
MKTYTGTLFIDQIVYDRDGRVMDESTCKGAGTEEPFHFEAASDADAIEQARTIARDEFEYQEALDLDDDYCPREVAGNPQASYWVNEITAVLDQVKVDDIAFHGRSHAIKQTDVVTDVV